MTATSSWRDEVVALIPALRAFAWSLSHNGSDADDLVQDTLIKAWTNRDKFELGTNLRAWLFTMLHHLHVNTVRKAARIGEVIPIEDAVNLGREPSQTTVIELNEDPRAGEGRSLRRAPRPTRSRAPLRRSRPQRP